MLGLRVHLNYILWRLKLRPILPRQIINQIPIIESGELLVPIATTSKLLLHEACQDPRLREGVLARLNTAAEHLPPGKKLLLVEGYRSIARQGELWENRLLAISAEYPQATREEVERLTRLSVAKPSGLGGGHQTGGAVDVTLCDADEVELLMGTHVQEFSANTPSFRRGLPPEIIQNRAILHKAMQSAGFANFPGEWWHFSYGDQMWAAYHKKPHAIYGPVR